MTGRKITYREFLTGQAASTISCLADAIDNGTRMTTEHYAVQVLEDAFVTARALLRGSANPDRVEGRPEPPE